jgi:Kdo2-lipid IVA lauroyltransferase/acyltransferase
MPDRKVPRLRWLFSRRAEQRQHAIRYWLRDPSVGVLNIGIHYGLRLLPIDACSAAGTALGTLAKYRFPESDARARKLWMRLRPDEADKATTDAAVNRLWRNVGRSMAEFSVFDRFWRNGRITIAGKEHLDMAMASGRPFIVTGLHLGNWEVVGLTMLALRIPGVSVSMPPDNRFDVFIASRARDRLGGGYMLVDSRSGFAIAKVLKSGRNVLLYIDELARGRVWAPAFGRKPRRQGNIAYAVRLARMTGAMIIPVYGLRVGPGARFKVTILPPVDLVNTGDDDADLMANIATIDALIDPIIRANLDQWFFGLDFEFDE